mmetsp:Transcript_18903/g.38490  ORF Transcript_18903/g.38490 Transcript_18903/m.38490 type:complete len:251 (+) Transcript_18903:269-1021(+)
MKALFVSHSPPLVHPLQLSSWSLHTVVHTPHESGHSFITARGLLRHSPASAQISHCVEFLSAHLTPSHTPQLFGHSLYMKPGFLKHSPSAVQPGQSGWMSLQVALQASHVTGHVRIINSGLVLHSPAAPQPEHSLSTSLHSGVHRPQLVGQSRSIESGFASHSPAVAHAPQETSVSLHWCVQMPQDKGHSIAMNFALSPMHSLSRAQLVQSGRLSLQMPANTVVMDRAIANSFIIGVGGDRRDNRKGGGR